MNNNKVNKMIKGYYTWLLEKGEHPYKLIYFEAKLLNDFIYDPRYQINNFIFKCNISIKEPYYNGEEIDSKNKIILDNIGFGYDENNMRIVAIFLKNLTLLPSKIQQRFYTYEITSKIYLDSTFINSINGKWSDKTNIFKAIHYEMEIINKICKKDKKFFRKIFRNNNPSEFNIIILPTKNEYNSFITTFDKLLSDNINKEYFEGKVELIEYTEENEKIHKGTKRLLKEWLGEIGVESEIIDKIVIPIGDVRNQRNKPSHSIYDDEYDINFTKKQTKILIDVYHSLKCLIEELIKYYGIDNSCLDNWFINNEISTHSLDEIKINDNENYQMKF